MSEASGASGGVSWESLPAWQLERRERIVDAALHVLGRSDYDQIQIRDIAEAARVARATLYRYFASKDHLYAVALRKWASQEGFDAGFPDDYTAEECVRAWNRRVIGAIERQPRCYRALLTLQDSADPDAKKLIEELSDESLERLSLLLEPLGPGRAADTAIMLYSIVNTLAMRVVYYHGKIGEVYRVSERFIDSIAADLS